MPTAKELSSLPVSYSVIRAKWIPAFDPNKVISGYQLSWRVLEDDKGQHVINSPLQLSEILPVNASGYEIKNLSMYSLLLNYVEYWKSWQGRRKIDNWGGVADIHIFVFCNINSFLKSIVFTVCEHEYMNISPPIIDLPPPLYSPEYIAKSFFIQSTKTWFICACTSLSIS